ncbi:hypothetical protein MBAV_001912 [Candidatus Magnetobacterium bavaricum]|uniref:Uncharacterized protein n=1 Tax=Candidatus Magnetobacterium bavaricum TaxID=29290 RepID=A0A0F3GVI6_9BACT|nr:hypothetical protein MBAV_001912 [Candidatus Magnetobacterium bavaricum]
MFYSAFRLCAIQRKNGGLCPQFFFFFWSNAIALIGCPVDISCCHGLIYVYI